MSASVLLFPVSNECSFLRFIRIFPRLMHMWLSCPVKKPDWTVCYLLVMWRFVCFVVLTAVRSEGQLNDVIQQHCLGLVTPSETAGQETWAGNWQCLQREGWDLAECSRPGAITVSGSKKGTLTSERGRVLCIWVQVKKGPKVSWRITMCQHHARSPRLAQEGFDCADYIVSSYIPSYACLLMPYRTIELATLMVLKRRWLSNDLLWSF